MKGYEEYKNTGYDWLPTVPAHWNVVRNKSILREKKEFSNTGAEELLSVSQYTGVTKKKFKKMVGIKAAESLVGYKVVKWHDLVMNIMLAWNGSTGVSRYDGVVSPAYAVFEATPLASSYFLHYVFRSPLMTEYFKAYSTGIVDSRLRLYPEKMAGLVTALPPREEQDQIVRYLDAKVSKINMLIRVKQKQIALLKEKKQAIINQAVTKGLDPNVSMKDSGIAWIGQIPGGWEVKKIKRVCNINPSVLALRKFKSGEDMVVFLAMEAISVDGNICCAEKRKIKDVKSGFSSFAKGDVVVAKITPCFENGKGACLDNLETPFGYGSTEFITLRPTNKCLSNFLYYITKTSYFRLSGKETMTGSAGQKRVSSIFIAQFETGIPPIKEQAAIVEYLGEVKGNTAKAINALSAIITLLTEYRTRLISDVVTGKVDVRGIAVPDADALLETDADVTLDDEHDDINDEMITDE